MNRKTVASSNIASWGYDEGSQTLEIEFHHGGIYQYEGVPPSLVRELDGAGSVGQFFHQRIKQGGFSSKKL